MRSRRLVLAILALLPLAACGRKGPLSLPPKDPPAAQKKPDAQPPNAGSPDPQGTPPKPRAN